MKMNFRAIEEKVVFAEVALTKEEREYLINGIYETKLRNDDPKYDDWNRDWLDNLPDVELFDQYCKSSKEYYGE